MPMPLIIPSVSSGGGGSSPGPGVGSGAGTTFINYVRDLAEELWFRGEVTVSTLATNAEASRTILVNELRDDEYEEDELGGWWVYVKDGAQAGQQRRVMQRSHHGSESALMLSRPFAAPLAAGVSLLVTWPLPVVTTMTQKGLKALVNEALNRIRIEGRIPLTGTGYDTYSLATYKFLRDIGQTTGLYDRLSNISASNANQPSGYGYRFAVNGSSVSLVTDNIYSSGTAFDLGVIVEADRLIYDGAAWGYASTPGLVNDTDEAAAPQAWVRSFSMVKALQHLTRVIENHPRLSKERKGDLFSIIEDRRPTYAAAAAEIALTQFPEPVSVTQDGFVSPAYCYGMDHSERVPY